MKIFIPTNVPSSKNSRVWTGRFFIASKAVAKWRKETKPYWEQYKDDFLMDCCGKGSPIEVRFTFVRGSKHKFDYANPLNTIQDEMVKHGYIPDDNADEILPVLAPYIYDKVTPGVYIEIL